MPQCVPYNVRYIVIINQLDLKVTKLGALMKQWNWNNEMEHETDLSTACSRLFRCSWLCPHHTSMRRWGCTRLERDRVCKSRRGYGRISLRLCWPGEGQKYKMNVYTFIDSFENRINVLADGHIGHLRSTQGSVLDGLTYKLTLVLLKKGNPILMGMLAVDPSSFTGATLSPTSDPNG